MKTFGGCSKCFVSGLLRSETPPFKTVFVFTNIETDKSLKIYLYFRKQKKIIVRSVSYFYLSPRHLKLPMIGPFENTQEGLQRTTHWMWERRVEQHQVLDPRRSQVSVDRIARWVFNIPALENIAFSYCYFCRCAMATWFVRSPPGRAVRVRVLARDIVLCSWARHWVLANLKPGVTLRWTSIPSRYKYA